MPALGDTVAALARLKPRPAPLASAAGAGRLRTVEGFGADPGELRMRLYAPERLAAGAPLVVVLHGCSQTAEGYAEGAGWLTLADRLGFAVLAPEQTRANNANLCFNWFEPEDTARGGGEAASIRAMVQHAVTLHRLDPGRVFVTGLSAGGAMTAVMLATYPEVFAAGAVVAGLPYGAANGVQEAFAAMFQGRSRPARDWGDRVRAASSHRGPWPRLSIWHGEADATVKPGAGDELARQWTDLHGLTAAPAEARSADGRRYLSWRGADGASVVELHRIPGMAHGTPLATAGVDGVGTAGPFLLEVGVSSSLEIAAFWGLAKPSVRSTEASKAAPERVFQEAEPRARQAPPFRAPDLGGVRSDVADVIAKALRSAGLLK